MSHGIFKSIKQKEDGTFDTIVAESNVRTVTGAHSFSPYCIHYYNDTYEYLSKNQKKLLFVLDSLFTGDVFYPANWKRLQKHADHFIAKQGYSYADYIDIKKDGSRLSCLLLDFENYLFKLPEDPTRKYRVKVTWKADDEYITLVKGGKIYLGSKDDAKVFTAKLTELKERLAGYNKYGLIYEEV